MRDSGRGQCELTLMSMTTVATQNTSPHGDRTPTTTWQRFPRKPRRFGGPPPGTFVGCGGQSSSLCGCGGGGSFVAGTCGPRGRGRTMVFAVVLLVVAKWTLVSADESPSSAAFTGGLPAMSEDGVGERGVNGCHGNGSSANQDYAAPGSGSICLAYPMKNQTRYEGETTRIECEITGDPLPDYRWYHENVPVSALQQDDSRLSAKPTMWGSRLRIENLRLSDAGWYRCDGQNRWGHQSSQAYLHVITGRNPGRKYEGGGGGGRGGHLDELDFYDEEDEEEEDEIVYHPDYNPNDEDSAIPAANPNQFDSGRYSPRRDDENTKDDQGPFTSIYRSNQGQQEAGFCQLYRGTACATFMAGKYIYVTSQSAQGRMEERMAAALMLMAESRELSPECGEYAVPTLCYYAFPECHPMTRQPRQICRDECRALTTTVCDNEFRLARQHHLMGHDFVLPNCEELPEPDSAEGRQCVRLGLLPAPPIKPRQQERCYEGDGSDYRGSASTTVGGLTCQRWSENYPHAHYFTRQAYPEIGEHNFCRNPGREESGPWCFTLAPNVKKQLCNVPKCVGAALEDRNKRTLMLILVPCAAIVGTLALLLIAVCCCRARTKSAKPPPASATQEMNSLLPKKKPEVREFQASALRLYSSIGDSACGAVYRGDLIGYYSDSTIVGVLAKVLPDEASPHGPNDQQGLPSDAVARSRQREAFYREMGLLADMKHPNLMCMLGAKLQDKPVCMIFEQHREINLQQYLVKHSPQSEFYENGGHILNTNELIHIVTQIAAGMEYLSTRLHVHKDLAARTCFINEKLVVKISHFGLIQEAYLSDYYRVPNCESRLPVRWMPIEAILYGQLGWESDVWSYGVVLWEVFSYGLQPYYGYSDQEVLDMLQARQMLPSPDECPSCFYALMHECWHAAANQRPSFKQIHTRLIHWKSESVMNSTPVSLTDYGPIGPTSQSSGSQHSGPTSQRSHLSSHQSGAGGMGSQKHSTSNNTNSTGRTPDPKINYVNGNNTNMFPVHQAYRQPYINMQIKSPYQYGGDGGQGRGGDIRYMHSPPGSVTSDQRSSSIHSSTPSSTSRNYGNNGHQFHHSNRHYPGVPPPSATHSTVTVPTQLFNHGPTRQTTGPAYNGPHSPTTPSAPSCPSPYPMPQSPNKSSNGPYPNYPPQTTQYNI